MSELCYLSRLQSCTGKWSFFQLRIIILIFVPFKWSKMTAEMHLCQHLRNCQLLLNPSANWWRWHSNLPRLSVKFRAPQNGKRKSFENHWRSYLSLARERQKNCLSVAIVCARKRMGFFYELNSWIYIYHPMRKVIPLEATTMGDWAPWSSCSVSCGVGGQSRQRQCHQVVCRLLTRWI